MAIELSDEAREEAIASIQTYSVDKFEERIGNIAAGGLLDFFLEEIGPSIYNRAVSDAQERMQLRIMELDIDVNQEEFPYWPRRGQKRRRKSPGS